MGTHVHVIEEGGDESQPRDEGEDGESYVNEILPAKARIETSEKVIRKQRHVHALSIRYPQSTGIFTRYSICSPGANLGLPENLDQPLP